MSTDLTFVCYDSPRTFLDATRTVLMQREVENNLLIGIAQARVDGAFPAHENENLLFCAILRQAEPVAAAMLTPPYSLVVSAADTPTIEFLAAAIHAARVELPGVVGETRAAEDFSNAWSRLRKQATETRMQLRIYRLDHVTPVTGVSGKLINAQEDDLERVFAWTQAFERDAHASIDQRGDRLKRALADQVLFFWEDGGEPVAMAASMRATPHGMGVNIVYTPPEHRGRGYASALVAAVSQHWLDRGYQFCFLFTDLANPTSNRIYQQVGYRPVTDFHELRFASADLR